MSLERLQATNMTPLASTIIFGHWRPLLLPRVARFITDNGIAPDGQKRPLIVRTGFRADQLSLIPVSFGYIDR